jgi:hypothetical protein
MIVCPIVPFSSLDITPLELSKSNLCKHIYVISRVRWVPYTLKEPSRIDVLESTFDEPSFEQQKEICLKQLNEEKDKQFDKLTS